MPDVDPDVLPDPVLDLLLDPDRLSALVDAPVRATRVRPKVGVSHVAALASGDGDDLVGWVHTLSGEARAKAEKLHRHAGDTGRGDQVRWAELPEHDTVVLWGPVASDPRLAPSLGELGLDALDGVELLRYNPLRRLVLRRGEHVLRVTATHHRGRLARVSRALRAQQVPVLEPVRLGELGLSAGRRVSAWRWVAGHDLAGGATTGELRSAGAVLARLHATVPAEVPGLEPRGWQEVRAAAVAAAEQLRDLAPEVAEPVSAALAVLPRHAVPAGRAVTLHGDLSLDQFFTTDDGKLVLGDLDRACVGPAEIDLADVVAVAVLEGQRIEPLLEGYVAAGAPVPDREGLRPWVATALLTRVSAPWRMQLPDWAERVRRCAALALAEVTGGAWTVPDEVAPGSERVRVDRAWPDTAVDGVARVAVEGRDEQGRRRAGTVDRLGRVRLTPSGADSRLPALERLAPQGELLVHRHGRRAVLALTDRYVKVVRPGRAPAVAAAAQAGHSLAQAAGLDSPRVLEAGGDTVSFAVLPGRSVHDLSAQRDWPQVWHTWAQAWARLQVLDPRQHAPELVPHTPLDEARVLRTWRDRAAAAGVLHGTGWLDRLGEVAEELAASPEARLVPSHRDLHDKQLVWHDGRLGVLDFDTACLAEPELDLANLAVHARLRHAQGLWAGRATSTVLEAVSEAAQPACPGRFELAERATVARLAAVYAFRPRWRQTVLGWAEQEWRDVPGPRMRGLSSNSHRRLLRVGKAEES